MPEADPRKPYKMYAAVAAAMIGQLLAYSDVLPMWVVILASVVLAGVMVFKVPNPIIEDGAYFDDLD